MTDAPENPITESNAHFTIELFKRLSKTESNVIFSPISVHTALSMVFQGAIGTTAESLAKALQVPNDAKTVAEDYQWIITRLNNIEKVTLSMANKLFVNETAELRDAFNLVLSKHFLSELQKVNFAKNTEAAGIINKWVEEKTKNKIKNLISPDTLDELTRLVLINAIYFKGDWETKFDKAMTKTEPFCLDDKKKVDVQMMHIPMDDSDFKFKYDVDLDAEVIEFPYTNKDMHMVVILPNKKNGINELKTKLATINLANITDNMREQEVWVSLPRFKIESTMDLKEPLTQMGLGVIFDKNEANFSGIANERIYVSQIIQKACIEVNEDGAEAAAATGLVMRDLCFCMPPSFIADHPFVFVLLASKDPIFIGQVMNPNEGNQ